MPTLAAYFHTLSPFIVRFTDSFGLRWYGTAYLAGFLVAYLVLVRLARKKLILLPPERVGDAMLWLIGGTLVGGRVGYAVFYDPTFHLLTGFSKAFPFWDFLAINKGGMASHGGMIGLGIGCWRISRGWRDDVGRVQGRSSVLHVMDYTALVAPFGVFLGRIANFVNGELLGAIVAKPGTQGPWWSVQYPQELEWHSIEKSTLSIVPSTRLAQTPEQWSSLLELSARLAPPPSADPRIPRDVALAESLSAGMDYLATSAGKYAEQLKPLIAARHPTQFYQAFAEGAVVGVVLWVLWAKPRKPGVITAAFFMTYGLGRIVTELYRLPDVQMSRYAGLSMGQWLSVGMVVVGGALLWYATTRPAQKLGGWRQA